MIDLSKKIKEKIIFFFDLKNISLSYFAKTKKYF